MGWGEATPHIIYGFPEPGRNIQVELAESNDDIDAFDISVYSTYFCKGGSGPFIYGIQGDLDRDIFKIDRYSKKTVNNYLAALAEILPRFKGVKAGIYLAVRGDYNFEGVTEYIQLSVSGARVLSEEEYNEL